MSSLKNRRLETLMTLGIEPVLVPLSFDLNGSSDPASVQGLQCTVVHAATGRYTVTLPAGFPSTTAVVPGLHVIGAKGGGSTSGLYVEATGTPASGTFEIRVMNGGTTTLVDVAASQTVRVGCMLMVAAENTRSKNV